ncbi:tripartite motif-containing protein 46 [Rhodovulum sulfidophilum]|uniref:Tripartite motif-containing protein 46 n=1 Tax=Rhodovulum sulfidophilum TaxID=35806 RepID=A0A0D6AWL8_RHOSU|nr:tripartite motif-containing protein 46 [Rhodovulum sulfidophilum]
MSAADPLAAALEDLRASILSTLDAGEGSRMRRLLDMHPVHQALTDVERLIRRAEENRQ